MTDAACVHCGQAHPPTMTFCPETGRPLRAGAPRKPSGPAYPQPRASAAPHGQQSSYGPPQPPFGQAPSYGQPAAYPHRANASASGQAPPYPQPSPYGQHPESHAPPYDAPPAYGGPPAPYTPGAGPPLSPQATGGAKPVGVLLTEAFELYRSHLAVLLATAAIVIVPLSLVKSTALALMLAPVATAATTEASAKSAAEISRGAAERWERQIQAAQQDPKSWAENTAERQREQQRAQKDMQDLSRTLALRESTESAAPGGLMATVLGYLALVLGLAVMSGIAIPLVMGAITIVVADRVTGGDAGPAEVYRLLSRRVGNFLSASIPAFFCVLAGLCLLFIPGFIVGFLFTFLAPVVLLENAGGIAALTRSVNLVKANLLQVAVVCLVFAIFGLVASAITHFLIPRTWLFVDSFVEDLLLLLFVPLPTIATVLLYLDVRRQADGLDEQGIRAGLDALRG
jgi:hypothetical protein